MYHVTVRPNHPSGAFQRDGRRFTVGVPVTLTAEEMTDAIRREPWLVVREVTPAGTESGTPPALPARRSYRSA